MDRSVSIVANELFTDNDRIFVVATIERHETDQNISPKCQLALIGRGTIGEDFAFFHLLAGFDQRFLILTRSLVQANVLFKIVNIGSDFDTSRINVSDLSGSAGPDKHAGIIGDLQLHAGTDDRRLGHQKRNSLSLHVGTHQRTVSIIVLQERNQASRNTDHLSRRDVHVGHLFRRTQFKVSFKAGNNVTGQSLESNNVAVLDVGIRRSNVGFGFFVGAKPSDFVGYFSFFDDRIRRHQETIIINTRVNRQRRNQTNVGTFRSLDRTDSTVVRNVNIANFEARSFTIQTTGTKCRKTTLVSQL